MMLKKLSAFSFTALYFLLVSFIPVNPLHITVKGKVVSGGKGVPNVQVTDGVSIVETDKSGNYSLKTTSQHPFVYYTLPAGYTSPVVNGTPIFYHAIDSLKREQQVNFQLAKAGRSQQNHAFIVWADPQVMDSDELGLLKDVVKDVKQTVAGLSRKVPVHGISCGDIVFDRLHLFEPYKKNVAEIGMPFYQSLGNHDMDYNGRSDERSAHSYQSAFGPAYYSYNVGNIHYITLKDVFYYGDSYQYFGYVDEDQLEWLEKDLAKVKKGSTVVVTVHIPTMYGDSEKANYTTLMRNSVMNRKELYRILSSYNTHIVAGHSHTQWNTIVSPTIFEHVHAAASGAWWQGEIATDGSPKGYTVYTVSGDSLSWYFKGVNASKDEQMKLYRAGSDTLHRDHFIANVFNYDPVWKVWWYENGKLMGEMEQYWGKDPLANATYLPGKNKKHSWLSTGPTHHLFKAKPHDPKALITVVVKDRFGQLYKKQL